MYRSQDMPHRIVSRLGEFDVRERLAPLLPPWAAQLAFAIFCLGLEALLRFAINLVAPGAAPFALIFPAILAATLFAGWQCGLIVLVVSELLAWYFVLGPAPGFSLTNPADGPRMGVIAFSGLIVIALADIFRRTVQTAARYRTAQVEERDLLLREIDHRMKNNFMMVASLIDIQRRRATSDEVREALTSMLARIESFARAHRHLYHGARAVSVVDMRAYLDELCDALAQALTLHGAVVLTCHVDEAQLDRDRAVTIGLLVNELVTNAAKHAFAGRESGHIEVRFERGSKGWTLTVADDGVGIGAAARPESKGGLGQRLVEAFARQASGELTTESGSAGTRLTIDFKD